MHAMQTLDRKITMALTRANKPLWFEMCREFFADQDQTVLDQKYLDSDTYGNMPVFKQMERSLQQQLLGVRETNRVEEVRRMKDWLSLSLLISAYKSNHRDIVTGHTEYPVTDWAEKSVLSPGQIKEILAKLSGSRRDVIFENSAPLGLVRNNKALSFFTLALLNGGSGEIYRGMESAMVCLGDELVDSMSRPLLTLEQQFMTKLTEEGLDLRWDITSSDLPDTINGYSASAEITLVLELLQAKLAASCEKCGLDHELSEETPAI